MQAKVFLTGATGFLGTHLAEELIKNTDSVIYALVRAQSPEEATKRLATLWWERPLLKHELSHRIIPVVGNIQRHDLGIDPDLYEDLTQDLDYIIHSAAEVSINKSKTQLVQVNVQGTINVLSLADYAQTKQPLKRFAHVSTAYVAGNRKGMIFEKDLINGGFGSLYEQSKFEAEQIVATYRNEIPLSVFRPGQIVGDSHTGAISTFNTLYYPLKLYLKGELGFLPISKQQKVNMVPVDYVAQSIVTLMQDERACGKTFHLTLPADEQPRVGELIDAVREWANSSLGVKLRRPLFVSLPFLGTLGKRYNLQSSDTTAQKSKTTNILALAPYFFESRTFDTSNCDQLLSGERPSWKQYLDPLLTYGISKGFLNHSDRSVFEQMQFRLARNHNPITYFDVSATGFKKHTHHEVSQAITKAANALRSLGITRGDRVALTGTNGTNYLIIDAAIGLTGATSVPLYYTSPLQEIDALLEKSAACLLFVGTQKILEGIPQLTSKVRVVSLLARDSRTTKADSIIGWEDFLELGIVAPDTDSSESPFYDDLATIRYTSGTTGQPKGVTFTHYQLKWMAETLPSLLSWKTRNRKIRYLSFLPLSHVVEGILVAYAPYYILSNVDIYYLNEFNQLTTTLPKVRPTIFFSVPRFYEKVWEQFTLSKAGKYYLTLEEGPVKKVLRKVARSALLKKAGLDKCSQLIVGSAPVSAEMLQSFRELGIEIHNAYGLTEAPLITLSRLGENELGSVGRLLPQTEAVLADDGEILIRGPQISQSYDGDKEPAVSPEGFFPTGDFGHLSSRGNLIIEGRKKEVLITSYGKNINPQKIETRLKTITSISEALVLGDSLPYCSALLWLDEECTSPPSSEDLEQAISLINEGLSHPEQIKKWMLLSDKLSISSGELTPNLKLRRNQVQDNYRAIIKELYPATATEHAAITQTSGAR